MYELIRNRYINQIRKIFFSKFLANFDNFSNSKKKSKKSKNKLHRVDNAIERMDLANGMKLPYLPPYPPFSPSILTIHPYLPFSPPILIIQSVLHIPPFLLIHSLSPSFLTLLFHPPLLTPYSLLILLLTFLSEALIPALGAGARYSDYNTLISLKRVCSALYLRVSPYLRGKQSSYIFSVCFL